VVRRRLGSGERRLCRKARIEGRDCAAPRRVRVQPRQIFCFAKSADLGWYPQGREIAMKGLEYLLAKAKGADGRPGFVHLLDPDGSLPGCINTICSIPFWAAGTINSIATADHWSILFRPPHSITFSGRPPKQSGFSASFKKMKKDGASDRLTERACSRVHCLRYDLFMESGTATSRATPNLLLKFNHEQLRR
jgi:hypothetical protein